MKENKTKPDIRFTGFTDDWEQRKFKKIFSVSQGLQIPVAERYTEPGVNRYFYITNEFLKENCTEEYYIESPSGNVLCDEEDILMTRTGNTGIVVTGVSGCFHNNFFKIKYDKNKFSKEYICYLLSSSHMQKIILNSAGSSTIPDLSHKSFYKIEGYFPNFKEEQEQIGTYFKQLDNLITLHQREKRKDFRKKINIIVGYMNLVIIYKDYGKEENMATRGKSINLFLMDGEASGRIKCTLANWTGLAYKIPRIDLDRCKNREDLKQSGVYFLFGKSENSEKGIVYIGQAGARKNGEGILDRLKEHKRNSKKDYWTEAIVFTTSNNSFGPTEISYLENRFCNLAKQANRYEVKNENDPTMGNITEEKESEMEEFIDYAKVVMGTLGHKVFEPYAKSNVDNQNDISYDTDENNTILYLKRKVKEFGEVQATGMQTSDGFVVFSGSHISTEDDNTVPQVLKERKKTVKLDENGNLIDNMPFSSPSYAAMFVIGKSANGLVSWKDENGKTLKDLELNK